MRQASFDAIGVSNLVVILVGVTLIYDGQEEPKFRQREYSVVFTVAVSATISSPPPTGITQPNINGLLESF